jgi:hypothetical protein
MDNGVDWPVTLFGSISAALLAGALIPQYYEIYRLKEVKGERDHESRHPSRCTYGPRRLYRNISDLYGSRYGRRRLLYPESRIQE